MQKINFRYLYINLKVDSDFELPELVADTLNEDQCDIVIEASNVPVKLDETQDTKPWFREDIRYQVRNECFLLLIPGIGRFCVSNGNKIQYLIESGADDFKIRTCLLGTLMGVLCLQRKRFALHASTVSFKGVGMAFVGPSGVGKSTMVSSLINAGCELVCDDMSVVEKDTQSNKYLVHAGYPCIKLWSDTCAALQINSDNLQRDFEQTEKYLVPFKGEFSSSSVPLKHVFLLDNNGQGEASFAPINSMDAVDRVRRNTYKSEFIVDLGLLKEHFLFTVDFVKSVEINYLHKSESLLDMDQSVSLIHRYLESFD